MKKKNIKKIVSGILIASVFFAESISAFGATDTIRDQYTIHYTERSTWGINLNDSSASVSSPTKVQIMVTLHKQDGSLYRVVMAKNGKIKLPSMANPKGCTFMGWSRQSGKKVNPEYEAGDVFCTDQSVDLYPVIFNRSTEPDLSRASITVPKGYDWIIFVGDSRTYALSKLLNQEFGSTPFKKISFVAKSGTTLSWLKSGGTTQLMQILEKNKKNGQYAKTAVIFNHGVNSIKHNNGTVNVNNVVRNYCTYMKKLGPQLIEKNCDLYYMSVNPVNSGRKNTSTLRKGEEVRKLNNGIRKGLSGMYNYIDTYSYLIKNGYGTASKLVHQNKDDGTHYTYTTYKRIFAYCMKYLTKKVKG